MVHEFEVSRHAASGKVNCLDCHAPKPGQQPLDHNGFVIAKHLTAQNCKQCHRTEYDQFLRCRHVAPAWAEVGGPKDFIAEQVAFGEKLHPGWLNRAANPLVGIEGTAGVNKGCYECHARHVASVELARLPQTCGQCHMGPDHSQIEIYEESRHGVLFNAQRSRVNLAAAPATITTADMPVPTCSTCHIGGLNGIGVTQDTTERLSYFLFAAISERRRNYQAAQARMQQVCLKCHTRPRIDAFYQKAEAVIESTNQRVRESQQLM
ncbi:MAG TPA: multiheme c-type cytochrome [Tepidisphaeraceae bacterium]